MEPTEQLFGINVEHINRVYYDSFSCDIWLETQTGTYKFEVGNNMFLQLVNSTLRPNEIPYRIRGGLEGSIEIERKLTFLEKIEALK